MLGTQGDEGFQFNRVLGDEVKLVLLGDGGEQQLRFQHGKVVADAEARSAAKGKVGEAVTLFSTAPA